jgi:murein DD-endopeptidase MepM/ murein hydrolase activator NlpD
MLKSAVILIFLIINLASCSQEPAKIVYKGHNFYGKNIVDDSIYQRPAKTVVQEKKIETSEENSSEIDDFISVKPGDSLFLIAKNNKIPLRNLIEANNLEPPYKLYPGDKLKIPSQRNTHVVRYGENISIIAHKYGISSNDITSINNLSRPYIIRPGQILVLPYNIVNADTQLSQNKIAIKADQNEAKGLQNKADKFIYPVNGKIISEFGDVRNGVKNDGINISAKKGSAIKTTASGKVVYVGNALKGYGNLIVIKHENNWLSAYAHNDEVYITKNQEVKQGEVIATVGVTGDVETSQLYFSLRKGRQAVDPKIYLSTF